MFIGTTSFSLSELNFVFRYHSVLYIEISIYTTYKTEKEQILTTKVGQLPAVTKIVIVTVTIFL